MGRNSTRAVEAWAYRRGAQLDFIRTGKPVEHAFIEACHGRLQDECLNGFPIPSLADAPAIIEACRGTIISAGRTARWGT